MIHRISETQRRSRVAQKTAIIPRIFVITLLMLTISSGLAQAEVVVDTNQSVCYDTNFSLSSCPAVGAAFYGQDAQYDGIQPSYTDNGNGTVTDNNTGLMWQQDPGEKMTFDAAKAGAETFNLAGYTDWRLPSIKELYSLILFSGFDPGPGTTAENGVPFIDTNYFVFEYGDETAGERLIDAQYASSTEYVSTTMNGDHTMFGVNFADGRIKGYGTTSPNPQSGDKTFFVLYVRGHSDYGVNNFVDNGDETMTDSSVKLMWMKNDSGSGMVWEDALDYCETSVVAGYDDWRLPNAKELQRIVDYTRSPDTTNSAAIDPLFNATQITDEAGNPNYAFYWTGTTHANSTQTPGRAAGYIAFGEALGWMQNQSGTYELLDVHGAGAQRSDPKIGDPNDYPYGFGPQGDVIRIYNFVRCVRDAPAASGQQSYILWTK